MTINRIIIDCVWRAELVTLAMLLCGYAMVTIERHFQPVFNTLIRLMYVPVSFGCLYTFTTEYNFVSGTMQSQYIAHSIILAVAFLPICIAVLIRKEHRIATGLASCALLPLFFVYIVNPLVTAILD